MGTYYISADKDSILAFIQKFAYEEDLGKVRTGRGLSEYVHGRMKK